MNWLIINHDAGGWFAAVANTDIQYYFAGNAWQQINNLIAFGNTLQQNDFVVSQFFDASQTPPGTLEQQLFAENNTVVFEGDLDGPIAPEGEDLFDILEDVGDYVLEMLGALGRRG